MDDIKDLLIKQNELIEYQNKILRNGFDALLRMVLFTSAKPCNQSTRDILTDFWNVTK